MKQDKIQETISTALGNIQYEIQRINCLISSLSVLQNDMKDNVIYRDFIQGARFTLIDSLCELERTEDILLDQIKVRK